VEQLIRSVMSELHDLKEKPVSDEELRRSKANLKGATLLSLESTGSRMSDLARQYLYFGRYLSPDDRIASMEAVTQQEIQQVANELFQRDRIAASLVGSLDGFALTPAHLAC
jgi:predicted Zn-dependent peptidase